MTARYGEILFTPAVQKEQELHGSRTSYARLSARGDGRADMLGDKESLFIAARDSFYLASTSASGWPYIQHRGGPPGFVKRLDEGTLAFADYRGNRQYISLGNLATDDRVALFFMDYPRRARLKLLGRMTPIDLEDDPALSALLVDPADGVQAERGFVIHVEAFDWNCPQYITPRFTVAEVEAATAALRQRIAELEVQLAGQ